MNRVVYRSAGANGGGVRALLSLAAALALLSAPARSQGPFFDVAVSDDARLVFTWSRYPLVTERAFSSEVGLYQFANGSTTRILTDTIQRPLTNWELERRNAHITGDGETLIWTLYRHCLCCSACIGKVPSWGSYVFRRGAPKPDTVAGQVQISSSGRYMLRSHSGPNTVLQDLQTGSEWTLPTNPPETGKAVTSDGRVLLVGESGLTLWSPTGTLPFAGVSGIVEEATVSDDGRAAIYRNREGVLTRVETGSGAAPQVLGAGAAPMLSRDGELALFRRSDDCLLARRGAEAQTLRLDAVKECVLSGSGNAAVAILKDGRILRVDLLASPFRSTELTPPTPYGWVEGALAPGSLLIWRGQGRVQLQVDGKPLPLVRDAGELWFQAPFDLQPEGALVRFEVETGSPFGFPPRNLAVHRRIPYFLQEGAFYVGGYLIAAHDDFRGLVNRADPARAGEVVHLWAVGLGVVSPSATAGVPAPLSPVATLVEPFDCRVLRGDGLEVPFAGLAPGLAGIYQVDVRLPATIQERTLFLDCGTTGVETQRHGGVIATAPAP
jgi:uncharacterized protein (TIGR03437 family)